MGVPAFFRWLSRKYPSVIAPCVEEKGKGFDGRPVFVDWSQPNPNGVEFDNLYLDMNGIIHPCTHPEDKPAPNNEDEMMIAIFECIDRLLCIVRPRKLLYMAIDGVAPRAKMNQQRSRRFRASKETVEKVNDINRIRAELLLKGANLPPEKLKEEHFDSNCITPGTPFMARLSECLTYYVYERLNSHPGWQSMKVILSDANVPGEGEHKIMEYIRKQRAQPDHDPNTRHCLCGADADLIMLGLATHEPNFTIIREEFKPNKPRPCDLCGQIGHELKDCTGLERNANMEEESKVYGSEIEYIFVRLNVLREYLERELAMPNLPFQYDFDRVLDDWVFMCFFVGNDFLPHLPSLEIREGAIDRLISLYKDAVYKTGGFLTENGDVNLERVQLIMTELGKAEDIIFKTRQQKELQFKARESAKRRRTEEFDNRRRPNWSVLKHTQFEPTPLGQSKPILNPRQEAYQIRKAGMHSQTEVQLKTTDSKKALESMLRSPQSDKHEKGIKRSHDEVADEEETNDEVRLWEDGFKDRYYQSKFDVDSRNLEFRNSVALHYVRGLCWVLRYYYQGCASWKWYFPYHYAPFASDFINISGLSTEFETGTKPFEPLQQLMGVFPAASSKHVPAPWAKLMSDVDSTIIDFYPEDFKIDLNGKKFAWQGVALLPFVDEKRLFKAVEPYYKDLSPEELKRNICGDEVLFVSPKTKGYEVVQGLYQKNVDNGMEVAVSFSGMTGTIFLSDECVSLNGTFESPVRGLKPVFSNKIYSVKFRNPKYREGFVFLAKLLKGAKLPLRVLKPQDLDEQSHMNWRPQIGMAPSTKRATLATSGHRMINHNMPQQSISRPFPSSYNESNYSYHESNYRGNYQRGNQSYSHQERNTSHNAWQHNSASSNVGSYNNYRGYSNSPKSNSEHPNYRRTGGPYRDRFEPHNSGRSYKR